MDFVVDNSIVMSWCFKNEASSYADEVLDSMERKTAVVPAIWPLELGNVLLVAERKKRLTVGDSSRFLALLSELPIVIEQETPERMLKEVFSLARNTNLSSYDASYLDLAIRRGLSISTLDKNLIRAAKKIKVPIFSGTAK
ncbi:type II toxin-antitoxin system VapC family toxin [bacterium]|nr:type II toxin-antitoxin system VapC family toxin [bacterium]